MDHNSCSKSLSDLRRLSSKSSLPKFTNFLKMNDIKALPEAKIPVDTKAAVLILIKA